MKKIFIGCVFILFLVGCANATRPDKISQQVEPPLQGQQVEQAQSSKRITPNRNVAKKPVSNPVRESVSYLGVNGQFLSTCFAVQRPRDGKIIYLSALHALDALPESRKTQLTLGSEQRPVARILKTNSAFDLVALESDATQGVVPLQFGSIGESAPVTVESYSFLKFHKSVKYILSKGYALFFEGGHAYFAINIFYAGGSGAPVLNEQNQVCAMAIQRSTAGNDDIYTGVIDAIPSDTLRQFIDTL